MKQLNETSKKRYICINGINYNRNMFILDLSIIVIVIGVLSFFGIHYFGQQVSKAGTILAIPALIFVIPTIFLLLFIKIQKDNKTKN